MAFRLRRFAVLAAALLLAVSGAFAQVATSGRLTGTVMDATQAAVPGANITITDDATGATVATQSGGDGSFTVGNLRPATYTVRVTSQGFKTAEIKAVKIVVGQTYTLSVSLEVGEVQSTVTVEAGAEVLKVSETAIATTITGKAIQQLPFTSRDALDLGVLMPGAQTTGRPRGTSFMGLPKGSINITFDGINAQDNINKTSDGFFTTIRPRVDSIEEFSINTVAGGAEQAAEGAVQIRFETKRGTNEFHGGAWYYHRNDFLNSNYYFNNISGIDRQRMRLHQFGYQVGGPIWKDKVFFFHAFDFYRKPDSQSRQRTILTNEAASGLFRYAVTAVPATPAWATLPGDFTCSATTLQCVANLLRLTGTTADSAMASILSAVNSSVGVSGVGLVPTTSLFSQDIRFTNFGVGNRYFPDFRFDWSVSPNHQISAIYHYSAFQGTPDFLNSRDYTFPVAPFNTNQASQNSNRNQFSGQWRWNVSSTKSNMLIFGVVSAPVSFFNDISEAIYPQITTNLGPIRVRPTMPGGLGLSQPFLPFGAFPRNTSIGQINDTFSYVWRKHSMNFGFSGTSVYGGIHSSDSAVGTMNFGLTTGDPALVPITAANLPGAPAGDVTTNISNAQNLTALVAGRVSSYSALTYVDIKTRNFVTGGALQENYRQNEFGFFGTDSWRMTPTFTMNYGLRWEYQGSPYGVDNIYYGLNHGSDAVWGVSGPGNIFLPGVVGGAVPQYQLHGNGEWYAKDKNNWAPSMGLAWNPAIDHPWFNAVFGGRNKSVFRAGYAINFTREGTGNWLSMTEGNPGFFGSQNANGAATASATNGTFLAGTVTLAGGNVPNVVQSPSVFGNPFNVTFSSGNGVNHFQPDLKVPYVQSWYFSIQREITPAMVMEVRYEGNHAPNLWRQLNLNETNIFENGFLDEFLKAQSNITICRANSAACIAAQTAAGATTTTANSFANWGLAGQVTLPIMTGAFTGANVTSGCPTATTGQCDSDFRSGTFIPSLDAGLAGNFANTIAGSNTFFPLLLASGRPSNFFRVNPDARGGAFLMTNGAHSTYNSLVVEVRRRMASGLQFQGNYTWSHSLTNLYAVSGSSFQSPDTIRDYGRNKGPSPFDTRHAFKFNGIYELPFGPGKRWSSEYGWLNRIMEGWEISALLRWQTGRATLVTGGGAASSGTVNQNDGGVELIGITARQIQNMLKIRKEAGKVYWLPASLLDANQQRANLSFIRPCSTPGKFCQRLYLFGPNQFRPDINIVKNTKVTERVNIQFRAEFLNAFNNANFLWAGTAATGASSISSRSTTFGRVLDAYQDVSTTDDPGGRIIQLVLRVNF